MTANRAPICTACPYCGVGCGVVATADGAGGARIVGDRSHPANYGALCVKGTMLGDTLDLDGRLLHPRVGGGRASWDTAIAHVADRFAGTIRNHGPDSVAFYVSGQLLTEDYYVANKLMKGFIGSANIDTNSRLCMASSVAGHRRAFGADVVPGAYEDLEQADVIVLVGSNLAWCHPVLARRIAAEKSKRPDLTVVNVDPRRTATSDISDQTLMLAPGSDVALFNGLLAWIVENGAVNEAYVRSHTEGYAAACAEAAALDLAQTAQATGLSLRELTAFYALWTRTERVVTVYSQGVNQSVNGVDKVNAILNCHLATGRIGRAGCGPFSVTGQPNAMGGREVGGLANMLAAHMELENPWHRSLVQGFWNAPRMAERPGAKAVELFDRLADGRIKALWIMATNPAVSLPDADRVRTALGGDAFVVVSDIVARTDTADHADVLLPATGWGEKDGSVTNSERRISRQRPFLPAPDEARHDWRIICDVAAALGERLGEDWSEAFDYASPAAVFREHAALSGHGNSGDRAFDISAWQTISDEDYEAFTPFQWPAPSNDGPVGVSSMGGVSRFFAEGGFLHPDGKARFLAVASAPSGRAVRDDAYPLTLNTGRVRDHWHTMTRTAKSAKLSGHIAEPFAELSPLDAERIGVSTADLVRLETPRGAMIARALVTDRQQPGSVFAPMHWTAQTASLGRVDALVDPIVDPISGQPASKGSAVRVERFPAVWYGYAVSTIEPRSACPYWARARAEKGWRIEMAGDAPLAAPEEFARELLAAGSPAEGDWLAYEDSARGVWRYALFDGARALGAVFLSSEPVQASRAWLADMLGDGLEGAARLRLLAGRPGAGTVDAGPTMCVCHSVGANAIRDVIQSGARTVDAVGSACAAGTNCGSCRPEIKAMIAALAPIGPTSRVAAE